MTFHFKYDIGLMGSSGLRYELQGDAADLPDEFSKTLEALAGYDPKHTPPSNPMARDLTQYEIHLEDAGKKSTLFFKEDNVPAKFRPLINHLRSKASLIKK